MLNGIPRWSKKARKGQKANPVKNKGSAHRKAMARLGARIGDYARMVDSRDFKAPEGAYHKPGSMKVYA